MKDVKRMKTDPPDNTILDEEPLNNNVMTWHACLFGPDETLWEDLVAKLHFEFTEEYPNKPPVVKFVFPKMFHPNIYADGSICLDILQNQWTPMYDISAVLASLSSLLNDPNTSSPANPEASKLYDKDREEYERRVRECVESSWVSDLPMPELSEEQLAALDAQLEEIGGLEAPPFVPGMSPFGPG